MTSATLGTRRPRASALRVAALAALLLARAGDVQADGLDCLSCHGDKIDAARFDASPHGVLGCEACHTDITEFPHPEKPAAPDCARCHDDVATAHAASVHGVPRGPDHRPAAGCRDCHGDLHVLRPSDDPASPVQRTHLAATCARCHAAGTGDHDRTLPVVRPVEAYLRSVHARAVAAGKPGATCADCHGAHDIVPPHDRDAPLARERVGETCGHCHAQELAAYRDSVHGEAARRGVHDAPVCTDCHGEHAILGRSEPDSPVFAANIPRETCGRCHGDIRLSDKYGLPHGQVASFEDSYHGLALRAGQLTAANCASCHGAHDIRPSSDPRSHVSPANLAETCGKCHPGAGTKVALGAVHVLPATGSARAVGWIRWLYIWLITGVVGGMFVHNALDLARKARRPARHAPGAGAEIAERMPRVLRWQHGLVMLSFATLVYSGFALTYPTAWWATPLVAGEGRFGLRRLVHRAAAVVMLATLVWHVATVLLRPRLRACLAGLMWSRRDLRDLAAALAYYVGRRATPPRPGTFGYIEKMEYWAFMWGSVLMAVTGFLLWFENVSLAHFPKWVTDVATAVHFWEAVLATLAILVWHLYWVIFDPDVYPMDASWWHGRPPAARAAERAGAGSPPGEEPPSDG